MTANSRGNWIVRAGLFTALSLALAAGVASPVAGAIAGGGAPQTGTAMLASDTGAGTLGNGWGG